jgi:hypothetical protein
VKSTVNNSFHTLLCSITLLLSINLMLSALLLFNTLLPNPTNTLSRYLMM